MTEEIEGRYETGLGWKLEITSTSSTDFDSIIAERIMGLKPGVDFGNLGEHEWDPNQFSEYNQFICQKCGRSSQDWTNKVEDIKPEIKASRCYLAPDHYTKQLLSAYEALQRLIADAKVNVEIERDFFNDWAVQIASSYESTADGKGYAFHPNLSTAIAGAIVSWLEHVDAA